MLQDTEEKRKERRRQRVSVHLPTLHLLCFSMFIWTFSLSVHLPPGAETVRGKQHPPARGEEGEEGSQPQAGVEHDGVRQRASSRSPAPTVAPARGVFRGLALSRRQVRARF